MSSFSLAATYRNTGVWSVTGDLSLSIFPKNTSQALVTGDIVGNIYFRNTGSAIITGVMGTVLTGPFAYYGGLAVALNCYLNQKGILTFSGTIGNNTFSGTATLSGKSFASFSGDVLFAPTNYADTFTAPDGTNANGRTLETGNATWIVPVGNGTFTINSNKLGCTNAAVNDLVYIPVNSSNYTVTGRLVSGANPSLLLAELDSENFLMVQYLASQHRVVKIVRGGGFSNATVLAGPVAGGALGDLIAATKTGTSWVVKRNGAQIMTFTEPFGASNNRVGFRSNTDACTWDDFSCVTAAKTNITNPLIVFDGNSLTYGFDASNYAGTYPTQTMAAIATSCEWYNIGVSGQTTPDMIADVTSQVYPLYTAGRKNIVVPWEIRNDIVVNGASAAAAYNNYVSLCQGLKANGFDVIVVTVLPSAGLNNTTRATVNASIRNGYTAYAVDIADIAADPNIGPDGANTNLTYYNADQIHMNNTGYGVVGGIVKAAVNRRGIT